MWHEQIIHFILPGIKLSDGKGLSGGGRFMGPRINSIQNFYGQTITSNPGNPKKLAMRSWQLCSIIVQHQTIHCAQKHGASIRRRQHHMLTIPFPLQSLISWNLCSRYVTENSSNKTGRSSPSLNGTMQQSMQLLDSSSGSLMKRISLLFKILSSST